VTDEGGVPAPIAEEETRAMSGTGERSLAGLRGRPQSTLKILTGVEAGRTQVLLGHETVIGRGAQCDLSIDEGSLSRRHCRVFRSGDTFVIEDLGSRNGTRVDGAVISFAVPLREGAIVHLAAGVALKFSSQDELEVQAQQRLYESAVLDALTGVHNRRHLDQRLRAELAFAARHQSPLSVLLLDIDHFKKVNDTLGHAAGDAALRALGERLQRSVRTEDVVARYGGEEFAVVARGIPAPGAWLLAERVRETVATLRVPHEGRTISFTISAGVVTMDAVRPFPNVEALLGSVDQALYRAKANGRNCCVKG
jgi:two-component system, cell cycle response regulator